MFGQRLESANVSELLSYDSALKEVNYDLYQSILKDVNDNDYDQLKEILTKKQSKEVSSFMKTS